MNNGDDLLAQAKARLPLSALMAQLGFGDRAKKSARCPFHDDSSASFSLYVGDDGEERWKCFAGCGQGDAIDFLAKHRVLSNADACRAFIRLAGVTPSPSQPSTLNHQPPFDWSASVAALTLDHRRKLADWRGYAPKFVEWLHAQNLIGLFDNERIAFPVHNAQGRVVGCHYRLKEDGSWRYHPTGTRTAPLVIGELATAKTIFVFESQWDFCAVADMLGWHTAMPADTAAVITRGSENGKLVAGLCRSDAVVWAFGQNDEPDPRTGVRAGEKWLATVAANSGRKTFRVVTPSPHKDPNDWTRAGATADEIRRAIAEAQLVTASTAPDLHAAPPRNVSKHAITLPPEDDAHGSAPAPFPIECLPPDIALMVHAVAVALRVPDSMPGLMALALISASIGKGLVLDWRAGKSPTPANLFILLSAESGTGKSECYKMIANAFLAFERAMQENWRKEIQPQKQADLRYHEGQLKKLDRKLAKDSTTEKEVEHCRGEQKYHLAEIEVLKTQLHEPQLSIQDATVERAAAVMHWNDETIFSTSGDARKLVDNLLGRYSANKNLADDGIYLNAFSGDDVKVDRQGREGVRLANPCLTLLWALQPDALDMLLDEQSLQQGGFLARCLPAHTHAEPQHIGGELCLSADTLNRWETLIRNLLTTYRQPPTLPASENESAETEI